MSAHPKSRRTGGTAPAKFAVRRVRPAPPAEPVAATVETTTVAGDATVGSRPAKRPHRAANVLIGLLLAALGFAIAVQIRSVSSSDALAGARPDELARILADVNDRQSRLQGQIQQLQGELRKLDTNGSNDTAARSLSSSSSSAPGTSWNGPAPEAIPARLIRPPGTAAAASAPGPPPDMPRVANRATPSSSATACASAAIDASPNGAGVEPP